MALRNPWVLLTASASTLLYRQVLEGQVQDIFVRLLLSSAVAGASASALVVLLVVMFVVVVVVVMVGVVFALVYGCCADCRQQLQPTRPQQRRLLEKGIFPRGLRAW